MRSVVDRNVVMWRMTPILYFVIFNTSLLHNEILRGRIIFI